MACNSVYYGLRLTSLSKNILVIFKGLASFLFVVTNMVNGYIGMKEVNAKKPCAFQILLFLGLTLAFIADVVIVYNFAFGAILFYISDFSLVLANFGPGYEVFSILCLYTYYPAQCLLASSIIAYFF